MLWLVLQHTITSWSGARAPSTSPVLLKRTPILIKQVAESGRKPSSRFHSSVLHEAGSPIDHAALELLFRQRRTLFGRLESSRLNGAAELRNNQPVDNPSKCFLNSNKRMGNARADCVHSIAATDGADERDHMIIKVPGTVKRLLFVYTRQRTVEFLSVPQKQGPTSESDAQATTGPKASV